MKKDTTIIGTSSTRGTIGIIGFIALICLFVSSCSKDDGSDYSVLNSTSFEVVSYMTPIEEAVQQTRSGEGLTRAWSKPSGFVDYEGGYQPIGACFTQDGNDPKDKIVNLFMSSGKWRANPDMKLTADTYYLYGYIPHQAGIKCSITDSDVSDGANNSYSTGAVLTLKDVPTAMPNDLCVVVGAKHGYDNEHDGNSNVTDPDRLRLGDFSYKGSESATGNYVFLLFDHLYASLKINMRVYEYYDTVRTIKLKSLKLKTIGESVSTTKTNIDIKLEATHGTTSPIKSISYNTPTVTVPGDGEDGVEFWPAVTNTVATLTPKYQSFAGYFMPMGVTTLILTSLYDVYDTKGNLIREDCVSTNTMKLKDLLTEQDVTERGKRYIVNMTIRPTFLYMLSSPDLDNPTVVLEP